MRRRLATGLAAAALGLAPGAGAALGLGDLEVRSRLGEPFEARIALVGVKPGDLEGLRVGPAESAGGRAPPRAVRGLRFDVVPTGESAGYVRVHSRESVREPALRLGVEASWPGGRTARVWSVVLDRP